MANLIHLFKIGQKVKCNFDETFFDGTVREVYPDYILVDVPQISNHCRYENEINICDVYPEYNF